MRCAGQPRTRSTAGFTAIELMVATVVSSILLLGVYGVLRQAQAAERLVTRGWAGERAAGSVADRMAEVVDRAVELPGQAAIMGGRGAAGSDEPGPSPSGWILLCVAPGSASAVDPLERAGWAWRYEWEPIQAEGLPAGTGGGVRLMRRRVPLSGSRSIQPVGAPGQADQSGEGSAGIIPDAAWTAIPAEEVASAIDAIEVAYRPTNSTEWADRWDGSQEGVPLVRIRVRSGDDLVTSVAGARTTAPLVPEAEEDDGGGDGGDGGGG